jgi:hypothetical protein
LEKNSHRDEWDKFYSRWQKINVKDFHWDSLYENNISTTIHQSSCWHSFVELMILHKGIELGYIDTRDPFLVKWANELNHKLSNVEFVSKDEFLFRCYYLLFYSLYYHKAAQFLGEIHMFSEDNIIKLEDICSSTLNRITDVFDPKYQFYNLGINFLIMVGNLSVDHAKYRSHKEKRA